MSSKTKAIIAILLSSVIGGAAGSAVKFAIQDIPPFSFTFIRFLIASVCLLPFLTKTKIKLDKDFLKLILFSLLATLNIGFFVLGIKTTTASMAQILYAAVPIITGLLSYYLFSYKMSTKRWLFIALGFLGVLLIIFLPLIQHGDSFSGDLVGNLLVFGGVISWALYATYSKEFLKKYSPLTITILFCLVTTVCFLFLSLLEFYQNNSWVENLTFSSIIALLYVSIFATALVYLLNQYAFKHSNAVIGSFNLYLLPIFAYISAFFILGERLTQGLIIGTVIVFTSIALTTYSK